MSNVRPHLTVISAPENSTHSLSRAQWRAWLEKNQSQDSGVWLVSYKKAAKRARVTYDEAVEEALCFGWIDSKPRKLDGERSMLWFAPRKAGTGWSRPNKDRVARMIVSGQMSPSGLAKVEAAKADGSWQALDSVEDLEIPPDLEVALRAYPSASQWFAAFPRSAKRGILEWIHTAKREQTRATRIAETARLAERNERANQWRRKADET